MRFETDACPSDRLLMCRISLRLRIFLPTLVDSCGITIAPVKRIFVVITGDPYSVSCGTSPHQVEMFFFELISIRWCLF